MNVKVAMATGAILMVMDLLNFFFPQSAWYLLETEKGRAL